MLPRALSTVVANNVSKLFLSTHLGGGSFPTLSFLCPGGTNFGAGLIPAPATIVISWGFNYFYGIGGMQLKKI